MRKIFFIILLIFLSSFVFAKMSDLPAYLDTANMSRWNMFATFDEVDIDFATETWTDNTSQLWQNASSDGGTGKIINNNLYGESFGTNHIYIKAGTDGTITQKSSTITLIEEVTDFFHYPGGILLLFDLEFEETDDNSSIRRTYIGFFGSNILKYRTSEGDLSTGITCLDHTKINFNLTCNTTNTYDCQIWMECNGSSFYNNYISYPDGIGDELLYVSKTNGGGYVNVSYVVISNGSLSDIPLNYSVVNTPPTISSVEILPSPAEITDNLNCSFVYSDIDGDLQNTSSFRWYLNDSLQSSLNTQILSSGNTTLGDKWSCSVLGFDGLENSSSWVSSTNVTIGDTTPPNITNWKTDKSSYSSTEDANITVECSDLSSTISSVSFTIIEPTTTSNYSMTLLSGNAYYKLLSLSSGTYNVSMIYCSDTSGNNANATAGNISFTVTNPSTTTVTASGGGGIAETVKELSCEASGTNWTLSNDKGTFSYDLLFAKGTSKRCKTLLITNRGNEPITIDFSCEDYNNTNICKYVTISDTTLTITPNPLLPTKVKVCSEPPDNAEYGDKYSFSIKTTDNRYCDIYFPFRIDMNVIGGIWFKTKTIPFSSLSDNFDDVQIYIAIPYLVLALILGMFLRLPLSKKLGMLGNTLAIFSILFMWLGLLLI